MAIRVGYLAYGLDRPLSGIGRYAVETARALSAFRNDLSLVVVAPFRDSPAGLDRLFPTFRIRGSTLPTYLTTGPPQIARIGRSLGLAVMHDPFGVSPFFVGRRFAQFRRVVTIHDMIPYIYPHTHTRTGNLLFHQYIPRTLANVDHVITVSEASKRDVLRFYSFRDDQVSVIYNGVAASFQPATEAEIDAALARYHISRPYILTVGALQERKNLRTLFSAYAALLQEGMPHQLVVVGKKAWKTEGTFQALHDLGLEDRVMLTGYVNDTDLPAVYSGAETFVFPSLYEGFGLPPLEAMACGVPVITSNAASLPEIVGGAGIMVDPHDVAGFTHALRRMLTDEQLHRGYGRRGMERARQFTWSRAAEQHLQLYQRLNVERQSADAT